MSRLALLAALPCLAACGGADPPAPAVPAPVSIATPSAAPLPLASEPDAGGPEPASSLAVEVTAPRRPDTKLDARMRSERDRERRRILEEETGLGADGGGAP